MPDVPPDVLKTLYGNWAEDLKQRAKLNQVLIAKDGDIPLSALEGYSSVKVTHNYPPAAAAAPAPLAQAAKWAGIAGLGGLLGVAALTGLPIKGPVAAPAPPAAVPAPPPPAAAKPQEYRVRFWVENGQGKAGVEPLLPTPPPAGGPS